MEKILSGDNDDRLQMEILEANNIILSWQQSHQNKDDIVELIDIKRIKDIMVKGPFPGCKVWKRSYQRKSEITVSVKDLYSRYEEKERSSVRKTCVEALVLWWI